MANLQALVGSLRQEKQEEEDAANAVTAEIAAVLADEGLATLTTGNASPTTTSEGSCLPSVSLLHCGARCRCTF